MLFNSVFRRCIYSLELANSRMENGKRILLSKYAEAENVRRNRQKTLDVLSRDLNCKFSTRLAAVGSQMLKLVDGSQNNIKEPLKSFIEGIDVVHSGMMQTFDKNGMGALRPLCGQSFDPESMEADSSSGKRKVCGVESYGWRLHGRVLVKSVVSLE